MAEPQKNSTPTPPDPKAAPSHLVPLEKVTIAAHVGPLPIPGKQLGCTSLVNMTPTTSEYWTVTRDTRDRTIILAYFKPGADLKRAPDGVLVVPDTFACWDPIIGSTAARRAGGRKAVAA